MAKAKQVDPANVVWHAPETIHATLPEEGERIAAALEKAEGPEEMIRIAQSSTGQFREVLGEEEVEGRIVPKYGDKLVWVNDTPDDPGDPAGHYEVYSGPDEDYQPVDQGTPTEPSEEA